MAKITTITNPLTGQPAQVDQLDHTAQEIDDAIARALPGGAIDIALQNKAPAGFGLGASGTNIISDANDATNNGWYQMHGGTANYPPASPYPNYCSIFVQSRSKTDIVQWAITMNNPSLFRRVCSNGVWGPWEWVNPPMELGKEYRTTERWNGKPVYAMTVDFGPLPNNTATYVDLPGWVSTNRAFSVNIVAHSSGETDPVPLGLSSDYSSSYWYISNPNGKLYIRSRVDLSGYTSCYVYLKYTKA